VADQPRLAVESIAGRRPYQEDAVLAQTLPDGRTLVAVADGMGGHAAGEVASRIALDTLVEAVEDRLGLGDAFRMANERVHGMAQEPGKQGMGTTLVAILAAGGEYFVANVGDSRVYLVSAAGIRRLTEDHSFVAEAVKRGQTEAEAMSTPWKDALTRSVGTEPDVEADVSGPHPIEADSAFVICSDGLYKTLGDDEIHDLFLRSGGALGAARSLVSAALDGGSDDNITVAIAEYGEVSRSTSAATMVGPGPVGSAPEQAPPEGAVDGADAESAMDTLRDGGPSPADVDGIAVEEEDDVLAGLPVTTVVVVVVAVAALVGVLLFAL